MRKIPFRYIRCWSCKYLDSPAARVVPYDSPARNFAEPHLSKRDRKCRINDPIDCRSSLKPWNCLGDSPAAGRENPVETGSINTRSVLSSQVYSLFTTWYGGAGAVPSSFSKTRLGARPPICSQTVEEPGPPLKAKVIGLRAGSIPSCL